MLLIIQVTEIMKNQVWYCTDTFLFKMCAVSDTNATQYMWLHSVIQFFSLIITAVAEVPMSVQCHVCVGVTAT